jgi:Pyridine nucleotide-disulphide oxidoreductase, dimerisation domain
VDPKSERLLGAAIVGAEAGELIHVFVALIQAGASARAIVDAEFVHPTFAEGLQSLVMSLDTHAASATRPGAAARPRAHSARSHPVPAPGRQRARCGLRRAGTHEVSRDDRARDRHRE